MSGIQLHPTKGVNPKLTYCTMCGSDGRDVVMLGIRDYVDTCLQCGLNVIGGRPRGSVCLKCERNEGWKRRPIEEVEHKGRIPSSELCNNCQERIDLGKKMVSEGGVYWECEDCGSSGSVQASNPLSGEVRKHHGLDRPRRTHECRDCDNTWDEFVTMHNTTGFPHRTNLSGEKSVYCQDCGKKAAFSTPHHYEPCGIEIAKDLCMVCQGVHTEVGVIP